MRVLVAFIVANAFGIALLTRLSIAPAAPTSDVELLDSLLARWTPLALAIATLLTAILAFRSTDARVLLSRHVLLWLSPAVTYAAAVTNAGAAIADLSFVALVAGIAVHGIEWLWRTRAARTDRELAALLGLVLLASALALLPYDRARQRAEADEPHYLLAMRSLVLDHDLDLRNQYDEGQYRDFYPGGVLDRVVIDVGTHQYPIRDPGLPLLGAIPFAIAGRDGVLVLMCAIVAAFVWRFFLFARAVGVPRDPAFLASTVAFVHPVFTYTTQIYPDVVALLVILLAAEALLTPTVARLAVSSALVGTLPLLTVRLWPAAVGIGVVLLVLAWRRHSLAALAAAILPAAAIVGADALLDLVLFEIPIPNAGYVLIRDQQNVLSFTPWIALPGLVLDRAYGLLARAPLYALAFLGAVPLARRIRERRSAALVALCLAWALSLAYIAEVQYWYADYAPSSRYIVATSSFVLLAGAEGIAIVPSRARVLAWIAAAWSALVAFGFALEPPLRHDAAAELAGTDGDGKFWTAVRAAFVVDPGAIFPSLFRHALEDWLLAVPWLVGLASLVVVGARQRGRSPGPKS